MLRARGIRTLVFYRCGDKCLRRVVVARRASTSNISPLLLEDAMHHAGPDFVLQASLYNIEKFFGWVSTTADFCGAISQAAPSSNL